MERGRGPQPVNVEARRGPTPILPTTKAHPHSEAASITGGYVYRGTSLPELSGAYIYGDYQTGIIWALRAKGETVTWHTRAGADAASSRGVRRNERRRAFAGRPRPDPPDLSPGAVLRPPGRGTTFPAA